MQDAQMTPAQKIAADVDPSELKEPYATVSRDAMSAIAGYISREYGDYGYQIGLATAGYGSGVFFVRHSDGSRFYVVADRYGNIAEIP